MKTQNCSPLLSKEDIDKILFDVDLYTKKSFHVINKQTKTYDMYMEFETIFDYITYIKESLNTGHTVIVKNLENYNEEIKNKCKNLGENVDVHMYLVPETGTDSFEYHEDDVDVLVHLLYGEKYFFIKQNDTEFFILLQQGSEIYLPQGLSHKAIPKGPSCLLSFGSPKEVSTMIKSIHS